MSEAAKEKTTLDWSVSAGSELAPHHVALICLLALDATNADVATWLPRLLPQQRDLLKVNRVICEKVQEVRKHFLAGLDDDLGSEKLKQLLPLSYRALETALCDETGEIKIGQKLQTATWVLEKVTGKARQEVGVDAGGSLLQFLQTLDSMKKEREAEAPRTIELEPKAKDKNPIKQWVLSNGPPKETT